MPNVLRQFKKAGEALPEVNPILTYYVHDDLIDTHEQKELVSVAGSWEPSDPAPRFITVSVSHA